jgi:hypothetical protein
MKSMVGKMNRDDMHAYLESHDWHYDNGWTYDEKSWSAYMRDETNKVVILERIPEEAAVIQDPYGEKRNEIWRGQVEDIDSLEKLVEIANASLS